MLYPQNGHIAIGSRRSTPTLPVAAAVVSDESVAPRKTPCCQLRPSNTRGIRRCRRAPKIIASIGTPFGLSNSGESDAQLVAGVVNRLLGCAAFSVDAGVHGRPCQSVASAGAASSCPSHHGVSSGRSATFVKIVSRWIMSNAVGFVLRLVPGTTPKKPASGFTAHNRPSLPGRSHAMSSPTVVAFQPGIVLGGTSIARFVLPHADGNAPVT